MFKFKNSKVQRFWKEDQSLTVMLVLLAFFIFVFVPVLTRGKTGAILLRIMYSVLLLTGIWSVAKQKKYLVAVSVLAAIGFLANWVSEAQPTTTMLLIHDLGAIAFNSVFAFAILVKTFAPGEVTYQRIEGSIVVYLLVGMVFTYIFHAVYLFAGPESFNNIKGSDLKEFAYFSFTSLTTMGYGDITPVHPLARSLANFEALIGQLYPAILIARLVTMEFESSSKKKSTVN